MSPMRSPPWTLLPALLLALACGAAEAGTRRKLGLMEPQQPLHTANTVPAVDTAAKGATARRRALLAAPSRGSPGRIPQALVNALNPANNPKQPASTGSGGSISGADGGDGGVMAAAAVASTGPAFGASHYKEVLKLSYWFYEAQRSGPLPPSNRVSWRQSAHLGDRVVGGYMDAGDTIKHALTIAETVMFLAWGAVDFRQGHVAAGQLAHAKAAVKWGADYLVACRVTPDSFVGLIGDPGIEHSYWGRPEEQTYTRRVYVWNKTTAASDLMGMTSAALASASILFRPDNATYANLLLTQAKQLYQWGVDRQGMYSNSFPGYPSVYQSSRYLDKLMLAAAWLHRATGSKTYLTLAHQHYLAAGGRWQINPYVSYDSQYVPAVALLLSIGYRTGATKIPGFPQYLEFYRTTFLDTWMTANGKWSIVSTPLGMRRASWSQWGNLRQATNVAFFSLLYAQLLPPDTKHRIAAVNFAKSQVDYALGSAGRSYIVGWGNNPPTQPHHRAASCPNRPTTCDWSSYHSPGPNPQVLYGALVAGPKGLGDDSYQDRRDDYVGNEVAIDYNAGLTGALAGLLQVPP